MNRELILESNSKPLEKRIVDIESIYMGTIVRNQNLLTFNNAGNPTGNHLVYQKIGLALIDYSIDDEYEYISLLIEDFAQLGKHVAHLVSKFNDRGLNYEEFRWLGSESFHKSAKSIFKPSEHLKTKPVIHECTNEDLLMLHSVYLQNKSEYFANLYGKYGNSLNF